MQRRRSLEVVAAGIALVAVATMASAQDTTRTGRGGRGGTQTQDTTARGRGGGGGQFPVPDSVRAARQLYTDEVLAEIKGKEAEPAETVFQNIIALKGRPARGVVQVMNAWSNALGVSCTHCHVAGEWAREDRPQKQASRDMMAMVQKINTELLPSIKNLRSPNPQVGCGTCHQGMARPGARQQ